MVLVLNAVRLAEEQFETADNPLQPDHLSGNQGPECNRGTLWSRQTPRFIQKPSPISGILMLLASLDWFVDTAAVLRQPEPALTSFVQEQTA